MQVVLKKGISVVEKLVEQNSTDYKKFEALFARFIAGVRWLNERMYQCTATEKDKREFIEQVIEPMDALWSTFTDEEKQHWMIVSEAVRVFNGTIETGEVIQQKQKVQTVKRNKQDVKKKWKKYFRSY